MWKRRNDSPAGTAPELVSAPPPPSAVIDKPSVTSDGTVVVHVPALRASLSPDATVSGRLSFTAPTRIDGTLRGEVRANDMLVIGETGFVDGTIRAARLIVLGQVRGEVLGAERVEIGPRGTLQGVIETHALIVQEGGQLDGDCRVSPPPAAAVQLPTPSEITISEAEGS